MMRIISILSLGAIAALSGCIQNTPLVESDPSKRTLTTLPENVLAIAGSGQDLNNVRVDVASNCFVYLHNGPVESTYLPLRNKRGQPICIKKDPEGTAAS